MRKGGSVADTILIVEDEPSVRQTFTEWLRQDLPEADVVTATDAESALTLANQRQIDVAILDWNLGAGSHGLQLLEDLHVFQPDLVAILVTGYADKATPLDALRLGVRDYFDKNQHLTREKFVASVRKQLQRLRPVKRERLVQKQLQAFRSAVERALPLVQTATALRDSVPLETTVKSLFDALRHGTQASAGLLILRTYQEHDQPPEQWLILDHQGQAVKPTGFHYASSLAAAVAFQQPEAMRTEVQSFRGQTGLQLTDLEARHRYVLTQALNLGPSTTAVIELFDKRQNGALVPFEMSDQQFLQAIMPCLGNGLKRTFQEQEAQALLLDALGQALHTTKQMDQSFSAPPEEVLQQVREGLADSMVSSVPGPEFRQIAERLERLAEKHGPAAVKFCTQMLGETEKLLDTVSGLGEG